MKDSKYGICSVCVMQSIDLKTIPMRKNYLHSCGHMYGNLSPPELYHDCILYMRLNGVAIQLKQEYYRNY
jgi:hypothetical protein